MVEPHCYLSTILCDPCQLLLQRATEAQRSLARDKDKPTNRLNHTAQQRRLTHLKQLYKHGTESPNGKLSSSTPGQRGVSQGTTRCTDNDLRRSAGASQGHDPSSLHGVIPGETEAGKLDAEWLALDEAVDLYIWSQTLPASGDLLDDL